jgi:hypothetical protein
MDTFHSAKIISLTAGAGITRAALTSHKACTICIGTPNAMGITLDFAGPDGTQNTGHIKIAINEHIHLPTRIYGATGDQAGSIIIYN